MKILYITTIGGTMNFFQTFIRSLVQDGHTVDIACNDSESKVPAFFYELGCKVYSVQVSRSPLSKGNLTAIGQIKKIVNGNQYDIVHCHTPIAAMCTRFACRKFRKDGTTVFYTAHGFHFYKGAPLKNWLMYYPVEKLCSWWTDVLITINHEDFEFSCNRLRAKKNVYVPGVGIDVAKFRDTVVDACEKRKEIGITKDDFMMISVGELNNNKNHEIIIRAISEIKNKKIHYVVVGIGGLASYLLQLAEELNVTEQVHLIGYRNDVAELYKVADLCCFPSFREGLGLAAIEGMAAGLPLIVSDNRGSRSYAEHNVNAIVCPPGDIEAWKKGIERLYNDLELRHIMGFLNQKKAQDYDVKTINKQMKEIYGL